MRVRNAQLKTTTSGRPTIPEWMLEPFALKSAEGVSGYLVPLSWKREIHLPPERSLEAWYFLYGADDEGWRTAPHLIIQGDGQHDHLASFIFEASIVPDSRKHRLACKDLLTDLGRRSSDAVWIAAERRSFSIWTDVAFQIWHHRLTG